jgi:hypothetical protein
MNIPLHNIKAGLKKIGMGSNLAKLFISAYGGHFHRVQEALLNLALRQDMFTVQDGLNKLSGNIERCLRTGKRGGPYSMETLLEKMAIQGFAPVEDDQTNETNAFLISEQNVGGVVEAGNVAPGVRPELWLVDGQPTKYALIPTSQSARLVIAEKTLWLVVIVLEEGGGRTQEIVYR